MRIFFAGPLTNLTNPTKTKTFYRQLEEVARVHGCDYFWAFRHGTDPMKNPGVTPRDVYTRDIAELEKSDLVVAYVGEPSTGTGLEIEHAYHNGIPVYLLYEKGRPVSRMLRGCPAVKKELVFTDEPDALVQFETLVKSLKV